MNISRWISNHQAAADRATRVIDAIREGSIPPIQRELAEEVMLCGRVTGEVFYGFGVDFLCDDIFVRVHGVSEPPPPFKAFKARCAAFHVCALGKLVSAHVENRVIVVSVKPGNYVFMGNT